MKYRVVGPYQVNHGGKNYAPGDELDVSKNDAEQWVERGYVEEVKDEPKKAGRRSQNEDKAVDKAEGDK